MTWWVAGWVGGLARVESGPAVRVLSGLALAKV